MRFTVICQIQAQDDIAEHWINASDRAAVAAASDHIDRELAVDPMLKGRVLQEGLRVFDALPLRAIYEVIADDRKVIVHRVVLRSK